MANAPNTPTNTPSPNISSPNPGSQFERDADGLKRSMKNEAGEASSAMRDARDAVTGKASQLASEARDGMMQGAEGAKKQATQSLHAFAEAVREAGDKLSESDQSMAAGFVRQAANGLERLSSTLGRKPFGEMIEDVRSFGRRNPTAFIAGSVLAGLAIGRFVRSSAEHENGHYAHAGYAEGGMRSGSSMGSRPAAGGYSSGLGQSSAPGMGSASSAGMGGSSSPGMGSSSAVDSDNFSAGRTGASRSGQGRSGKAASASPMTGSSGIGSGGVADQTSGISGGRSGSTGSSTGRAK